MYGTHVGLGSLHLLGGSTGSKWTTSRLFLKFYMHLKTEQKSFHLESVQAPGGEGFPFFWTFTNLSCTRLSFHLIMLKISSLPAIDHLEKSILLFYTCSMFKFYNEAPSCKEMSHGFSDADEIQAARCLSTWTAGVFVPQGSTPAGTST